MIADLTQAIHLATPNVPAFFYVLRGQGYLFADDLATASEDFDAALAIDANLAQPHHALGVIHLREGDPERAIEEFSEALRLAPGWALAYCDRGNATRALGEDDRALMDYDEALRLDATQFVAYMNRGLIMFSEVKPIARLRISTRRCACTR